jgi:hypothetical protein
VDQQPGSGQWYWWAVWSRLCGRSGAGTAKPGSPGQIRSGGRGQLAIRVLDLPIHNPQVLLRVGPNDLVAGDPAGLLGRRVDLEAAGQAAPERKLLGLAPTPSGPKVVQRGSRRPLGKRFWGLLGFLWVGWRAELASLA